MPGLDGEKLLRMRSAVRDAEVPIPFLVLTAVTDPVRRARLLREGASDAITKPFHTADLIARIRLHQKLVQSQRELIEKNRELEILSRTDPLTGLANRRFLDETLARELARARRTGMPVALALVDIDRFKWVNDTHGHLTGDAVLAGIAKTFSGMVRETDCAGRFGGEEFLVILVNNDGAGALVFAERLREAIARVRVGTGGGATLGVTVSIGVAAWSPDLQSPQAFIAQADEALYCAKQSGRDCVCVYSSPEDGG
jgi:diguanylate cyclase (GGDEF)-like protein